MSDTGYAGQRYDFSGNDWMNAIQFAMDMFAGKIATATLVKVVKVYAAAEQALGGTVGWVDVNPLVNLVDGQGVATPHGTVFGLPYFRLQGGSSAVILDPVAGVDIGIAVFANRDISGVKRSKQAANPGSFRRFDMADGMYLGGFLNAAPTQFLEFLVDGNGNPNGVKVTTPGNLVISAANCTLDAGGNLHAKGEVIAKANALAGGSSQVTLTGHTHAQPNDSHGDTEAETNAPTPNT